MAGAFEDREKAFEAKWARDEELQFRVVARRNKLLGLWAAGQMGLTGAKAEAYAKEIVAEDFTRPGSDDIAEKLRRDFDRNDVQVSDSAIRREIETLLVTAKIELEREEK